MRIVVAAENESLPRLNLKVEKEKIVRKKIEDLRLLPSLH